MTAKAPAQLRHLRDHLRAGSRATATLAALATAAVVVTGCVAGSAEFTVQDPAGFWVGLWHGAISVVTLIVGIFDESVQVYERDNIGGWYDFGFLLGVIVVWGGGVVTGSLRGSRRRGMRRTAAE